jgi:hypothetical protein
VCVVNPGRRGATTPVLVVWDKILWRSSIQCFAFAVSRGCALSIVRSCQRLCPATLMGQSWLSHGEPLT